MTAPATPAVTPYRSQMRGGRDGFAQLLRAEWTKLRTVRGWVAGMTIAGLLIIAIGVFTGAASHRSCDLVEQNTTVSHACTFGPTGPGGEEVQDQFYFVHRALPGDGSITARVTSLTEQVPDLSANGAAAAGGPQMMSGAVPWAKAGVIIKAGTAQGSAYAAMMATATHGVRMQYDFTHDTAGSPAGVSATSPVWLRLTRAGDVITGYESADGASWTRVGTAALTGLPPTVQIGVFTTSPDYTVINDQHIGFSSSTGGSSQATGVFDHVTVAGPASGPASGAVSGAVSGRASSAAWSGTDVGDSGGPAPSMRNGYQEAAGVFTVAGSGDIAPNTVENSGDGVAVERGVAGAFVGLIAIIVIAAMFVTAEYRRGLIRTTLAASPRRGRALLAKAVVIGAATFVVGLVAAVVSLPVFGHLSRANNFVVVHVSTLTEVRVVAGTAAVLAVSAVLAVAIGAMLRRSAAAVTTAILLIIVPYLMALLAAVPLGPADWLLRLFPGAAFAVQQTITQYPQVSSDYTPGQGYFPMAPWTGFAVLCAYAAVAMGAAVYLVRRRDV